MPTRTEIINRARRRADLVSSTFIDSTTEEIDLFHEAYREVYTLFAENGRHMLDADATLSLTSGVASLPSTFYACLHVWRRDGDDYFELSEVTPDIEGRVRSLTGSESNFFKITRTSSNARSIKLYPADDSGTYIVHYIPECPTLANGTDNVIEVGNSSTVLVALLAKKLLSKADVVNQSLEDDIKRLYDEVRKQAEAAQMTRPMRIQDTRGKRDWDAFKYDYYPDEEI